MTDYSTLRTAMVDRQVRPSDVTKFPVIEAMLTVRREAFVPAAQKPVAYAGDAIDLGHGRAMLDPRLFAKMLDTLDVGPDDLVLDVGCGLGYSSAVIAHIAEAVVAVEQDEQLAAEAEENLAVEQVDNAVVQCGALAQGAAKHGPYDAIILEGGVAEIPEAILAQLKDGGRIVAVFANGPAGQCRLGLKSGENVAWRAVFDALAPGLPGFTPAVEFAL